MYNTLYFACATSSLRGKVQPKNSLFCLIQARPYVRVSPDTPSSEIQRVLEHDWKMPVPTIVLEVITSVRRSVFLESHRQWGNLQEGLIRVCIFVCSFKMVTAIIYHNYRSRRQTKPICGS